MTRLADNEKVADWLLGGQVRRRVFEALARPQGCNAAELAEEIDAGPSHIYEVLRVLKSIDAVEAFGQGRYRLAKGVGIAKALGSLVQASGDFANTPVDRPPRQRSRELREAGES